MKKQNPVVTYYHSSDAVRDIASAAGFISKAALHPDIDAHYISLRDLTHRSDEGNTSVQLNVPVSAEDIIKEVEKRDIDRIFMMCVCNGIKTGIGVDLSDYRIAVSVPKGVDDVAEKVFDTIIQS